MDPYGNPIPVATPQNTGPSRKMLLLGGSLVFAVIIAFLMLLNSGGDDIKAETMQLSVKFDNLATLTEESQERIRDEKLANLNTDASLVISTASAQFKTTAPDMGIQLGKPSKALIAQETNADTQQKLEDADIAGTYSRVYPPILSEAMSDTINLMDQIYKKTKNQKLKEFLKKHYTAFQPIIERLDKL